MSQSDVWRPVAETGGKYEISRFGEVRNARTGRTVKPEISSSGYFRVKLYFESGKRSFRSVHRLVALAFIPNPKGLPQVDHLDCDKLNNDASNLDWVDGFENMRRAVDNGRLNVPRPNSKPRRAVRRSDGKVYETITQAARENGTCVPSICRVCAKKYGHKTAAGFGWEYA